MDKEELIIKIVGVAIGLPLAALIWRTGEEILINGMNLF